jgi:uncharacterized protein YjbI with pentapeptide repeats
MATAKGLNAMDRDEALTLLNESRIREWNRRRETGEGISPLNGADLRAADLRAADLRATDLRATDLRAAELSAAKLSGADLSGADLSAAKLRTADLSGADLSDADLREADLREANLRGANLSGANLSDAKLRTADLSDAKLIRASLSGANLSGANLSGADLSGADLSGADLSGANLRGADLKKALLDATLFRDIDLSEVKDLGTVEHRGPSPISTDTLTSSKGRIPDAFLRGCGLAPWEILNARLYDPNLTPHQITELQYQVFDKRTHGPLLIGGVFISYSSKNAKFVDKLYERLTESGTSVWHDRHDLVAGPLQKQFHRAIRLNDVVAIVLSEASIKSDWVENELEMARAKEREEKRDVLCPIALDDSWKSKMDADEPNRALWLPLKQKHVLDFSKWKTRAFDPVFEKLVRGLKINYSRSDQSPPSSDERKT